MQAEKKFNIPVERFPENRRGPNIFPDVPYPNAGNAELLPVVYPEATEAYKNFFDVDEENIVQFRHRRANGTVNKHEGEGQQIAKSMLLGYLQSNMDDKLGAKFGMCWRFPYGDCDARIYPEELLAILDPENEEEMTLYRQYKDGFNEKFYAGQRGGERSGERNGKRKTRKTKRTKKTRGTRTA
jgi:hypothetical protein